MSDTESTEAWVLRAQEGDRQAFGLLVQRYLRPSFSIALGIVGRVADAEDVAQDACVRALEHIETCRDPRRFSAWLFQIVRNRARNWLQERRLRDVAPDPEAAESCSEPARSDLIGMREALLAALADLDRLQREIVLLHDLEGWSHAEIAAAVGTSEAMSRQHLFAARRKLRGHLAASTRDEVKHVR